MKAKLIAYTQPVENETIGLDDVQDLIAYCAKVSNPKGQADLSTSESLLNYLIKHQHWSPFEMATATVEIETTRDIARQMLRHRSFAFQEFSQRYADPRDMENTFVLRDARLQDTKNRQNSVDIDNPALSGEWRMRQQDIIDAAKMHYNWAIDNGIAKEQARAVLPEGLTESRLYMSGNLRSWIHYCQLRMGNGTQLEHIKIANECWNILEEEFPEVTDAINNL